MRLNGKRVAILVEEGYQDLAFWVPYMMLQAEGAEVIAVGMRADKACVGRNGLTAYSEVSAADVTADDLDAIIVPGGWAPDRLRRSSAITELVRDVYNQGKPVGMMGHGGLVGISAGIVKGHRATGSWGIKDDLINAGAEWANEGAFRSGNIVWAQGINDIPAFCRLFIETLGGQ